MNKSNPIQTSAYSRILLVGALILCSSIVPLSAHAQVKAGGKWENAGSLSSSAALPLVSRCDYRLKFKEQMTGAFRSVYFYGNEEVGDIYNVQADGSDTLFSVKANVSLSQCLPALSGAVTGRSYYGASFVIDIYEVLEGFSSAKESIDILPMEASLVLLANPYSPQDFLGGVPTNLLLSITAQANRPGQSSIIETFVFPLDGSYFELEKSCADSNSNQLEESIKKLEIKLEAVSRCAQQALKKIDKLIQQLHLPQKWFR